MATQEVPVIPHTLPAGYCFTTLQDLLDTFSAHQTVELPTGATQIIVSESPPTAEFQDEIWLKVDGSGNPVNFYKYAGGSWKEVNPPSVFWGSPTTNVVDAYTTSVAKPPPALVTGQLYLFKVPAANTGAATLQVNAFGAFAFNAGGVAIPAGGLVVNSYVGAVWTGTTFELLGGVATFNVANLVPGTNTQRVTTTGGVTVWQGGYERIPATFAVPAPTSGGAVVTIPHTLGVIPDIVEAFIECTGTANNGFSQFDRIPLTSVVIEVATERYSAVDYTASNTAITIRCGFHSSGGCQVVNGSTGVFVDITASLANWKFGCNLWVF